VPTPNGHKGDTNWYSFDVGSAHFVVMCTELPCGKGSEQYAFLEADLAAVDRKTTPWVIISGHRPMYFTQKKGQIGPDPNFCAGAPDVEPLLVKYHVDLALWGHVHNAVVTKPVVAGKVVTAKGADGFDAPVHAIIGNGGQVLSGVPAKPPAWQAWAQSYWGWNYLTIPNATYLSLTFLDNVKNDVQYELELQRAYPRTAVAAQEDLAHSVRALSRTLAASPHALPPLADKELQQFCLAAELDHEQAAKDVMSAYHWYLEHNA